MRRFTILLTVCMAMLIPLTVFGFNPAGYDTVSIHDLQFVPNPDSSDQSLYFGDTVVVKGFVSHGPRELWVGARWACYVTDGTQNPWSGFFVIQHDTSQVNTLFGFVQEGDECYFTGVVDEFTGLTQLALLTNPVVPINFISAGNQLPAPKLLTLVDLETHAAGEQWEGMRVRIENATINNPNVSGNQASMSDGTGIGYMDDYFWYFRNQFNQGGNPWPANGTNLHLEGFTRDIGSAYLSINPRQDSDIQILTNPPVISSVTRSPGVPISFSTVSVTADIVDNGSVQSAKLHFSVNWGPFTTTIMNHTLGNSYSGSIPAQANNSYVRYFISAVDDVGDSSQVPGDTSRFIYSYVIRDNGLSIKDVQYTWGYPVDNSPFQGYPVTLEGVVTTDTSDWVGRYYIQSKDSAWYGMWIRDDVNKPLKGDWISVTGTVEENFGVTRLNNLTAFSVVTPNFGVFNPVPVTTGEIGTGGANAEAYESVLIEVNNVTVSDPFPDAPSNFGEFEINDGSGPVRVDDAMSAFGGNLDSSFALGDPIDKVIGVHYYSFGNYKILPRDTSDIIGHVTSIDDPDAGVISGFELRQNYPNPFNPNTTIQFMVPQRMAVSLNIYNILGQKVRTLFSGTATQGLHTLQWDGRSDAGIQQGSGVYFYKISGENVNLTRKMILMK